MPGFELICPMCHEADAALGLNLNNLDECRCESCGEAFTPEDARDMVAVQLERWEAVIRLIKHAHKVVGQLT